MRSRKRREKALLSQKFQIQKIVSRTATQIYSLLLPSVLLSFLEKGKTIAALKLLDFGLERDLSLDFSSYDKVLDALLGAGKTLNAYSVLCKTMEKGSVTDWNSCDELIKSLNLEGNTKQADVLSRMIKKGQGSKKHNSVSL